MSARPARRAAAWPARPGRSGRAPLLLMVGALGAALMLAACSGPGNARTGATSAPDGNAPASNEATAAEAASTPEEEMSELEALYWARQDSARMAFTEADVRFMKGMIAHHAQALVMTSLAPERGASGQVQTLAARIANAQRDEIASMQRWLREREQPVPEVEIDGTHLRVGGEPVHGRPMQGVLTEKQIRQLAEARGRAFDRLFLRYMIDHHRGAVVMVDRLFGTDGAAQDGAAFNLASDIHVDQKTEVARMERMLEALPGSS